MAPPRLRARYLWVVGLGVYIAAIWYFGWRRIGESLASLDVRFLVAMMLVEAAAQWLRAFKWRLGLGPGKNAIGLFFLSKATGYFSPGRVGELSPLLLKQHRTTKVAAWIVVDRLLEMSATLALGILGFCLLRVTDPRLLLTFGAAAVVLVAIPVYLVTRERLFAWFARRTKSGSFLNRLASVIEGTRTEILALRAKVPLASILTVLPTCMDIGASILLYRSLGFTVTFPLIAAVQCTHAVTSAIPITPNATGVPYAAAMVLLHEVAGIPYPALVAAVALQVAALNMVFWTSFGIGATNLRRQAT